MDVHLCPRCPDREETFPLSPPRGSELVSSLLVTQEQHLDHVTCHQPQGPLGCSFTLWLLQAPACSALRCR